VASNAQGLREALLSATELALTELSAPAPLVEPASPASPSTGPADTAPAAATTPPASPAQAVKGTAINAQAPERTAVTNEVRAPSPAAPPASGVFQVRVEGRLEGWNTGLARGGAAAFEFKDSLLSYGLSVGALFADTSDQPFNASEWNGALEIGVGPVCSCSPC